MGPLVGWQSLTGLQNCRGLCNDTYVRPRNKLSSPGDLVELRGSGRPGTPTREVTKVKRTLLVGLLRMKWAVLSREGQADDHCGLLEGDPCKFWET